MEGGFPYGDIIVIAAIAAFILLRYRAILGEPRGRDEPGMPPRSSSDADNVIHLPAARAAAPVASAPTTEDQIQASYGTLADTFLAMRRIDREFSPEEFLQGARAAYEMLISAFSKRDRETLKMLLAAPVYASFDAGLNADAEAKRITDTTLVAITDSRISKARLEGNIAYLTVAFKSEQVHLVRDEAGTIIEGDASRANMVEDDWVFRRDLTSNTPNWEVIET
jgi:predicted lipid-binding transport protein (Tim44 family)